MLEKFLEILSKIASPSSGEKGTAVANVLSPLSSWVGAIAKLLGLVK